MIDFVAIKRAALQHALLLLSEWLPHGHFEGDEYVACNPTRADKNPGSFKVNLNSGFWSDFATDDKGGDLISLFAYLKDLNQLSAAREVSKILGLHFKAQNATRKSRRHVLTIEELAEAKGLPMAFLKQHGVVQVEDGVLFKFYKADGTLGLRHQKRVRLKDEVYVDETGKERKLSRFFWTGKKGSGGILPYGLETLLPPRAKPLFVVEGLTDRLSGLLHGLNVLALPGASTAKLVMREHLVPFGDIVMVLEPDQGGDTLREHFPKRLEALRYAGTLRTIKMPPRLKDLNGLHRSTLGDPGGFEAELEELLKQGEELPISVKGSDTGGSEAFSADQIADKEPDLPAK